jgi:hypothetical protein
VNAEAGRGLPGANGPGTSGRVKALLVCSNGGHLLQLQQLRPWWSRIDRVWVTFRLADAVSSLTGERVVWAFHPTQRNVLNLLRNMWLAWTTLRQERPSIVVSTGAGVAPPFFLVARLLRIKTVYVEVFDRIDTSTMSGRLCYPMSTLFLLQWEQQKRFYPKGEVIGALF